MTVVGKLLEWWRGLSRNFKVFLFRDMFQRLVTRMTGQYGSLYIRALGASPVEVSATRSISSAVSALFSVPMGWLTDRAESVKRMMMLGRGLTLLVPLMYVLAWDWRVIILAIALAAFAGRVSMPASSIMLIDSLKADEKATGLALRQTLTSLIGVFTPLVAAFIVMRFGGISVEGIRPLYYIQLAGGIIVFIVLAAKLKDVQLKKREKTSIIRDFKGLFKGEPHLKRFLLADFLYNFILQMFWFPLRMLYYVEVMGAGPYLLGIIGSAEAVMNILFSVPLGRLADRVGRKKIVYLTRPLWYTATLLLILAPSPEYLILSCILDSIDTLGGWMVGWQVMNYELVPLEKRGRWLGMSTLINNLGATVAPLIGGFIWEAYGPNHSAIIPVILDVLIVLPLVRRIPETLKKTKEDH